MNAPKIVIVGDARTIRQEIQRYESLDDGRRRFDVLAVMLPAKATIAFPPAGVAYRDNPESHYLWRWLAMQAPDLVLFTNKQDAGLAAALSQNAVAGLGRIPARTGNLASIKMPVEPSEARLERAKRIARKPKLVLEQLLTVYGHDLPEATYIPAMALWVRLRTGELPEVEKVLAPYRDGARNALDKATDSNIGGSFLFATLAEQTGDPRYRALALNAADLAALETLHNEMSDSIFMECPLLAASGKLTGDLKYAEAAVRHWKLIAGYCLRNDNLYRHSPLNETAWGRGNAFAALGLALTLPNMPLGYSGSDELLRAYLAICSALARNQDENGMWREVIDRPGSYSELSATAMIGTAMLRGIRAGWLDEHTFAPRVERAWKAVLARTSVDGMLLDVCESTGKQRSMEDYLQRAASLGRDDRGGAMVLMFAAEMAGLR